MKQVLLVPLNKHINKNEVREEVDFCRKILFMDTYIVTEMSFDAIVNFVKFEVDGYICDSGASIYDEKGKLINRKDFSLKEARDIIGLIKEGNGSIGYARDIGEFKESKVNLINGEKGGGVGIRRRFNPGNLYIPKLFIESSSLLNLFSLKRNLKKDIGLGRLYINFKKDGLHQLTITKSTVGSFLKEKYAPFYDLDRVSLFIFNVAETKIEPLFLLNQRAIDKKVERVLRK